MVKVFGCVLHSDWREGSSVEVHVLELYVCPLVVQIKYCNNKIKFIKKCIKEPKLMLKCKMFVCPVCEFSVSKKVVHRQ